MKSWNQQKKTLSSIEAMSGKSISEKAACKQDFGTIKKAYNIKEGTVESDGSIQLSLFQLEDPTLSSLRDRLKDADINNMTPLQAFDLIRNMKRELGM